jgi:hypothetical protein
VVAIRSRSRCSPFFCCSSSKHCLKDRQDVVVVVEHTLFPSKCIQCIFALQCNAIKTKIKIQIANKMIQNNFESQRPCLSNDQQRNDRLTVNPPISDLSKVSKDFKLWKTTHIKRSEKPNPVDSNKYVPSARLYRCVGNLLKAEREFDAIKWNGRFNEARADLFN